MAYRVAYYAHHHGSGHLQHARDIIETTDHEFLIISSREFESNKHTVISKVLPSDVIEGYVAPQTGPFHYIPTAPHVRERFFTLLTALHDFQPDIVIVDVSVEVATFVKLAGYPVIYRHMHGNRTDEPHQNIYTIADSLVAYYDKSLNSEIALQPYVEKTFFTKMLRPNINHSAQSIAKTVTVLTSTGSDGVSIENVCYAAEQTPDWHWTIIGKLNSHGDLSKLPSNCTYEGFVDDPDTYLSSASVIVTSGGHNAIARTLAHEKPFVVTPESRPFDEQLSFAKALEQVHSIPCVASWQSQDWQALLTNVITDQQPTTLASLLLSSPHEYSAAVTSAIELSLSKRS